MKNNTHTKRYTLQEPVECQTCYGEGTMEVGPTCFKPASECCGGCYETKKCYVCQGTRVIWIDEDDEEMLDKALMLHSVRYRLRAFKDLHLEVDLDLATMSPSEAHWNMVERIDLIKSISSLSRLEDALIEEINGIAQVRAENCLND
jgi:RecJ-like exonuclease